MSDFFKKYRDKCDSGEISMVSMLLMYKEIMPEVFYDVSSDFRGGSVRFIGFNGQNDIVLASGNKAEDLNTCNSLSIKKLDSQYGVFYSRPDIMDGKSNYSNPNTLTMSAMIEKALLIKSSPEMTKDPEKLSKRAFSKAIDRMAGFFDIDVSRVMDRSESKSNSSIKAMFLTIRDRMSKVPSSNGLCYVKQITKEDVRVSKLIPKSMVGKYIAFKEEKYGSGRKFSCQFANRKDGSFLSIINISFEDGKIKYEKESLRNSIIPPMAYLKSIAGKMDLSNSDELVQLAAEYILENFNQSGLYSFFNYQKSKSQSDPTGAIVDIRRIYDFLSKITTQAISSGKLNKFDGVERYDKLFFIDKVMERVGVIRASAEDIDIQSELLSFQNKICALATQVSSNSINEELSLAISDLPPSVGLMVENIIREHGTSKSSYEGLIKEIYRLTEIMNVAFPSSEYKTLDMSAEKDVSVVNKIFFNVIMSVNERFIKLFKSGAFNKKSNDPMVAAIAEISKKRGFDAAQQIFDFIEASNNVVAARGLSEYTICDDFPKLRGSAFAGVHTFLKDIVIEEYLKRCVGGGAKSPPVDMPITRLINATSIGLSDVATYSEEEGRYIKRYGIHEMCGSFTDNSDNSSDGPTFVFKGGVAADIYEAISNMSKSGASRDKLNQFALDIYSFMFEDISKAFSIDNFPSGYSDLFIECGEKTLPYPLTPPSGIKAGQEMMFLITRILVPLSRLSEGMGKYASGDIKAGLDKISTDGSFISKLTRSLILDSIISSLGYVPYSIRGSLYVHGAISNRLVFPIGALDEDENGLIIGASGRIVAENKSASKYINSAGSPLVGLMEDNGSTGIPFFSFKKKTFPYGLNKSVLEDIRRKKEVVFVEGAPDAYACQNYGINNAVAALGAGKILGPEIVKYISSFVGAPIVVKLCMDADEAGQRSLVDATRDLLPSIDFVSDILIVDIDAMSANGEKVDPDMALKDGREDELKKTISEAYPALPAVLPKILLQEIHSKIQLDTPSEISDIYSQVKATGHFVAAIGEMAIDGKSKESAREGFAAIMLSEMRDKYRADVASARNTDKLKESFVIASKCIDGLFDSYFAEFAEFYKGHGKKMLLSSSLSFMSTVFSKMSPVSQATFIKKYGDTVSSSLEFEENLSEILLGYRATSLSVFSFSNADSEMSWYDMLMWTAAAETGKAQMKMPIDIGVSVSRERRTVE